jgi:hypothetical protein
VTKLPWFDGDSGAVSLAGHTRAGTPVPNSPRGRGVRRVAAIALAATGAVTLARLVAREGASAVLCVCERAGFGVVLLALAPAVGLLLHTLAWCALLPSSARPRLLAACRAFVAAQAGNELGFGLLGEPLKVLSLAPARRDVGISVVALDNVAAAVALVLFFAVLGGAVATPGLADHATAGLGVFLVAAGLAALVLLASERARGVARGSIALLTAHPFRAALAVALHLCGKLWVVAEMALAIAILDTATLRSALLLALASTTAATVGAPVPGQVGVVEGALVAVATAAGLSPATALAIGLLRRLRSTLWLALGGAFAVSLLRNRHATVEPVRTPCASYR